MSEKQKTITKAICESARLYKENLAGKTFLYVLEDGRHIEVMFLKRNFKHLTGVESPLHADDFYKKASKGELGFSQIYFSPKHPYRLAAKKVQHLKDISTMAVNELFILEKVTTETRVYQFGTTDMNLTLCLDEDKNNSYLVPASLRADDCFSKSENVFSIIRIYSKQNGEKLYTNIAYTDGSEQNFSPELEKLISK